MKAKNASLEEQLAASRGNDVDCKVIKALTRDNALFKERDHQLVMKVMELEQEVGEAQVKVTCLESDLKNALEVISITSESEHFDFLILQPF